MEIYVLNENFETIHLIDNYISFIWTDRYKSCGDFELYMPDSNLSDYIKVNNYIYVKNDKNEYMIIENIKTQFYDSSQYVIISGRSLASILDRRIILGLRCFNTIGIEETEFKNLGDIIKTIVEENVIFPEQASIGNEELLKYWNYNKLNRKINNFVFDPVTNSNDPNNRIRSKIPKNLQFQGDNLYSAIETLCKKYYIGFRVYYLNGQFHLYLYDGLFRTSDQTNNTVAIFSPYYDTLYNMVNTENGSVIRNVIIGAGNDSDEDTRIYGITDIANNDLTTKTSGYYGLKLKESYVSCESVKKIREDDYGNEIEVEDEDEDYRLRIISKSNEALCKNNKSAQTFEGDIDTTIVYKLGEDYDLGDVCELQDWYYQQKKIRVTEVIKCQDSSGYKMYPSLEIYVKDEEEE